ncbi:MAG TPA: hypothetical protein VGL61_15150 [Kofleriaceae bacterium]|jgi:hypothetical protein
MSIRAVLAAIVLPACLLKPAPPSNGTDDANATDGSGPKDGDGGSGSSGSGSNGGGSDGSGSADTTPRLVSYAYYSATTSTTAMTSTMYSISASDVGSGELLVLFASFNGSDGTFVPPAGFFSIYDVQYGGSDGQTFAVAYGISDGQPTTFSGNYGSGGGTPSIAMQLVAVGGAKAVMPIDVHDDHYTGSDSSLPNVEVTGSGDVTTAANCKVLVAVGADWAGPGMAAPQFSSPITEVGADTDEGVNGVTNFSRTSLTVGRFEDPVTGSLGDHSIDLSSSDTGQSWGLVIAIAPGT